MALMSMRQYAKHRGVSPEAVSKAVRTGRISTVLDEKGQRKINPEVADKEWASNSDPARKTTPTRAEAGRGPAPQVAAVAAPEPESAPDSASGAPISLARSRAVKEAFNARLAQLEYEEKKGKLVSADKVKMSAFKTAKAVRDSILNVPNDFAAIFAAETDAKKIHFMMTKALTEALEELTRALRNG